MKLQLALPRVMKTYGVGYSGIVPPLNLIALATYIRKKLQKSGIVIEILDGDILTQKRLENQLDGDFVGVHTNFGNYLNALKIAKRAKKKGAKVIFGGPYSSALAEVILKKHKYVDYIIRGDGEKALEQIILGKPLRTIKNLVFRDEKGNIVFNKVEELDINKMPSPDYSFLDLRAYFKRSQRSSKTKYKELPIYGGKGCFWRSIKGCLFCALPYKSYRMKSPRKVWKEIKDAEKAGATLVWNTLDDFTSDINWIREFRKLKPKNSPPLFIYSRANNITKEMARLLSDLNCICVFIGIESGNNKCLNALRKGFTVNHAIEAVRNLSEYGIEVHPSFVLGAPGETKESVNDTLDLLKKILEFKNIREVEADIMRPLPGSPAYTLLKNKLKDKYKDIDFIHMDPLRRDWVKNFCNVDFKYLVSALKKIQKLGDIPFLPRNYT